MGRRQVGRDTRPCASDQAWWVCGHDPISKHRRCRPRLGATSTDCDWPAPQFVGRGGGEKDDRLQRGHWSLSCSSRAHKRMRFAQVVHASTPDRPGAEPGDIYVCQELRSRSVALYAKRTASFLRAHRRRFGRDLHVTAR